MWNNARASDPHQTRARPPLHKKDHSRHWPNIKSIHPTKLASPQHPLATMSEEQQSERRVVHIKVTPEAGVDPEALYTKIKETITSQPEYKLVWDDKCKIEDGSIVTSFSIGLEADFDEEVMEVLEMMEGEVANQLVTFQTVLE